MTQFHTDEYIDFLYKVTPDNMDNFAKEQSKYNVGDDCPVFDGLFEFCGISAGGTMEGAALEPWQVRCCSQLGGWTASREEERSQRLLLC
jgi:hypothetical protein